MKLKPCPFCGGEADILSRIGSKGPFVFARCCVCNAQTRVKTAVDFDDDDDFWNQNAVYEVQRLWNTRAPVTVSQNSGNG